MFHMKHFVLDFTCVMLVFATALAVSVGHWLAGIVVCAAVIWCGLYMIAERDELLARGDH